jgi:peptidyl-prolyl cis-trans isomerase C/peptidyl-prolyl cis-trans isomerase D
MTRTRLNLALFALLFMPAAASAATELARINGTVISLEDFDKKYRESLRFFRYKAPTKKNVLDDLVKRELGIQEARKQGVDKDPEVRERMNTVLYHSLLDKKLAARFDSINVTDGEISSYYEKNPELRTSHIFVQVRFDATPAQEKAALEKIKKIEVVLKKGDKSFAEVARTYSEGVAAASGGDIDYQTKDKLDPAYYSAALELKTPGKVSSIVKTGFGYYIIKLTAVRPWEDADKGQVKRMVFDERRAQIFDKYMANLRNSAKVAVKADLIKD